MMRKTVFATLLALPLIFSACSEDTAQDPNEILTKHQYTLIDLQTKQHTVTKETDGFALQEAGDKIVLFDIFATWCPPCQAGASHLSSLQEKYKDDLVVIGVTIEDTITNEKLAEFQKNYTANYAISNAKDNRRLVDAIATQLNLGERFPIPVIAMYKNGKLVNHYLGTIHEEFIESDIKQALGK